MKIMLVGGLGFIGKSYRMMYDDEYIIVDYKHETSNYILDASKDDISCAFNKDIDVVIMLADINAYSNHSAMDYYSNNIYSTINVIKNLKKFKIKHIIYLSTSKVYGNGLNFSESSPVSPYDAYTNTKICCENAVKDYCLENNTVYQILRVSSVNGAILDRYITKSICSEDHLISNLAKGYYLEKKTVIQSPSIVRDYIHIKDLCTCINLCANSSISGIFNVGSGVATTSYDVANEFYRQTGYNGAIFKNENNYINNTINTLKFFRMFEIRLNYTLKDIVQDVLTFYRKKSS